MSHLNHALSHSLLLLLAGMPLAVGCSKEVPVENVAQTDFQSDAERIAFARKHVATRIPDSANQVELTYSNIAGAWRIDVKFKLPPEDFQSFVDGLGEPYISHERKTYIYMLPRPKADETVVIDEVANTVYIEAMKTG